VYAFPVLNPLHGRIAAIVLLACAVGACKTATSKTGVNGAGAAPAGGDQPKLIQPGAPGQPSHVVAPQNVPQVHYTAADVTFMQGMISHHSQAVEMTDLLATRTQSEDMRKLALRISLSQKDEIGMMQHWLQARGQTVPKPGAMAMDHMDHMEGMDHGDMDHAMMPGMLTPAEMTRLAAAKGPEFDRLFLEGMIKHHGGALYMVQELLKTPGAAQDPDIFAFVSDIDADQRMEIDRMNAMLKEMQK
jgi:uncharacterized protein (DUF305 family)